MPSVEKTSIAPPPEMIPQLRQLWEAARADKSPGLDPDAVLDALERKYQAMADTGMESHDVD